MKSLILALSFFAVSFIAVAQIPAGTKLLGGNFGYSRQNTFNGPFENKSSSLFVKPRYGWATKENVVVGVEASYSYNKNQTPNQPANYYRFIEMSVYKQKYLPLYQSFMVFGEGSVGANYGWRKDDLKSYGANAGLGGGIAYKAGKIFLFSVSAPNALYAGINYSETNFTNQSAVQSQSSLNVGIGSNISLQNMQFGVAVLF